MRLKGTKTEKNLLVSFAGESQARSRYKFFASVAKKEGYEQISAVFAETANRKRNTPSVSLSSSKGEWSRSRLRIRPE